MRPLPTAAAAAVLVFTTFAASPASAEAPTDGGCQDFGNFVAFLGTALGSDFGEAASDEATSEPQAFPTDVVFPDQEMFCS